MQARARGEGAFRRARPAAILGVLSLMLIGALPGAGVASAASVRLGDAPLVPAGARADGPLPGATPLHLTMALAPRDPLALAAYAREVSTPGSALYHAYLTVAEFRRRFAPTNAQIEEVRAALSARGLTTGPVTGNGLAISASTTAGTAETAFAVLLDRYVLRGGQVTYANRAAPALASRVAGLVQGVIGLDTLAAPRPLSINRLARGGARAAAPHIATGGPQPCADASAVNARLPTTYTADQIAAAYRFSGLYATGDLGAGQTIAVYELEAFSPSDVGTYQSCYGTSTSVTSIPVDGGPAGPASGSGEAALDVENLIGLVPLANILVYSGPNAAIDTPGSGPYDTYAAIISENRAKVISTSWGLCEQQEGATNAKAENTLFQEAAVQGQSIVAASGDSGAQDCTDQNGKPIGGLAVDDPASQPFVTGVGGTTLSGIGPPPSETVWNDAAKPAGPAGAGGGGVSSLWPMPTYQSSAPGALNVINPASSGAPCAAPAGYCREVPDVSANADPYTGYAIYYVGGWHSIGGTSAAAPTWAALLALANASPVCAGSPVGFANTVLYRAAGNVYSSTYNDILFGNNAYGGPGGFSAGLGYDMASGLGTPNGVNLSAAICDRVTVPSPGNPATVEGAPTSVRIVATSAAGAGLRFASAGLPPGLSLDAATGVISGTAGRAGAFTVTVVVRDGDGAIGALSFTWTVAAPSVRFVQPGRRFETVNRRTSLALTATINNGRTPSYSARGLPPGLSLDARTGVVSGVPRRTGRYSVLVTASDSTGASAQARFVWTIGDAPSVRTSSLSGVASGQAVLSAAIASGNGAGAVAAVTMSLPSGLRYHATRGRIRGLAVSDYRGRQVGFSAQLSRGVLTLRLRFPLRFLTVTLRPPGIQLSTGLVRQASSGQGPSRRIQITVVDANHLTTGILIGLRVS